MTTARIKYHQNNYIDDNFKSALFPLSLLQNIYFVCNYTIRNNFIHAKSYGYYFISLLFTIFIIFAFYWHLRVERNFVQFLSISIFYSLITDHFIYIFECLVLFINNVYISKLNIKLILNIQNVMKIFKQSDDDFLRWRVVNWIFLFGLYLPYVVIGLSYSYNFDNIWSVNAVNHASYTFALLYNDVNVICASRYMNIVNKCIKLWLYNIQGFSERYIQKSNNISQKKYNGIDHIAYFNIYIDIIDSFDKFKSIFQLSVSIEL